MKKKIIAAVLAAGLALGVTAAASSQGEGPPPHPPYEVDDQGRPVLDSLPKRVPVAGPDGEIIGHIPRSKLFPKPGEGKSHGPEPDERGVGTGRP